MSEPCCVDCGSTLGKGSPYCRHCGTSSQSLGKAFYAEPDPAVREREWKTKITPFLGKAQHQPEPYVVEPEPDSAEQFPPLTTAHKAALTDEERAALARPRRSNLRFITKAEPDPLDPVVDHWSTVFASIEDGPVRKAGS